MLAGRLHSDASIFRVLVMGIERRSLAQNGRIESILIKEMKRPDNNPHCHMEGLALEVLKEQGCEFSRIQKNKSPSVSTKKREIDIRIKAFFAIFNRELTRAVFSKGPVEQISNA